MRAACVVLALIIVGITGAEAQTSPPAKTAPLKLSLITAYEPCIAGSLTVPGGPACAAVRRDSVCGFSAEGAGKFKISKLNGISPPMRAQVLIQGLDAGCEGQTLCLETSMRVTNSESLECPDGCTFEETHTLFDVSTGWCCTVQGGVCKIPPPGLKANAHQFFSFENASQEAELLNCGVRRVTGPDLPDGPTFNCGYLVSP